MFESVINLTGKDGPIHAISWNPGNWNEWIAVYGHAPAKATLFNAKCEPLFEFGTGAWNSIYYPPDGTHILSKYIFLSYYRLYRAKFLSSKPKLDLI